ncbi:lysine N(6)-hydroxylase/L-ornithine N(5)-oxygenase family protein [Streptomyces ziwulingensis]|uniref:L-lysine N6-monooxygenase MbtG n=1 Tax=Streptomyces ziwulingensis TaxID=1045501 RepID=A0ABP9CWL5_9ACTN
MGTNDPGSYDVVGIGFGPANLALAIALEERQDALTARFFERKAALGWHRDMLVPSAKMQVSFLKDLVTFRNPASRFSFVSYLHAKNRLARFANKHDFFPTRMEFHDYLEWAETQFRDRVVYSADVLGLRLPERAEPGGPVDRLRVDVRRNGPDGPVSTEYARNVVISTGLVPRMPLAIERDRSVWHSSEFLSRFNGRDRASLRRVAVVGAGQSAAELTRFLYDELPDSTVYALMPSYGYAIADNTPFANEVFDPAAVDDYHAGSRRAKEATWRYHSNTNYSVVDDEVLASLYARAYDDEVSERHRLRFLRLSRATGVKQVADTAVVTYHSLETERSADLTVDAVVFATGYEAMSPERILGEAEPYCLRHPDGSLLVGRDYRLVTSPELRCGIYLQGGTEHTHGLASSLLSNLAMRGGDIAESLVEHSAHRSLSASPGQAVPSGRP